MSTAPELLSKLDSLLPDGLKKYDAFPKLPKAYKARSESRGFLTVFIACLTALLLLNDLSEYVYGWTDFEFGVDTDAVVVGPQAGRASRQGDKSNWMSLNVDMVVNMPCRYLSVDLRDAVGDRMYLSTGGLRRDGVFFDTGAATLLKEHSKALSAQQAISQSRKSRGFFDFIRGYNPQFKDTPPTYNHEKNSKGGACRIYGNLLTKKVTANLHVTTLGHGYASREHVDHSMMNLSHVITEFSFGSFFPDISQPLDNTFELAPADSPFIAYQYFLHVVPTTYTSPTATWLALLNPLNYFGRSYETLKTNQYSVTHYNRKMEHGQGTPGIFFKFDLDPMRLNIIQRTTSYLALLIRVVGVVGGVFTCISYALRVGSKAVEIVSGPSAENDLASAASSSVHVGHQGSWGKNELRARGKMVRQGGSWVMEGGDSAYLPSPYLGGAPTPYSPYMGGTTTPSGSPFMHQQQQSVSSPYLNTPGGSMTNSAVFPPTPAPGTASFGHAASSNYSLPPAIARGPSLGTPRTPSLGTPPVAGSQPGTPGAYASYPGPNSTPPPVGLGAPPAVRKMDGRKND